MTLESLKLWQALKNANEILWNGRTLPKRKYICGHKESDGL